MITEFGTKRRELGYKQSEIAEFLGISKRTVQGYEQNNRVPESIKKLLATVKKMRNTAKPPEKPRL